MTIDKFIKILKNKKIKFERVGNNLTVGGWLDLRDTNITALPDNLTVGGSLDLSGTNITALPDNLTVGGWLDLSGTNITAQKEIKKPTRDFMFKFNLSVETKLSWHNGKYRKIDGVFCETIKTYSNILKVKVGGGIAFIFQKDNISAHGETVRQAYMDWLFKTSPRNVEEYKSIDKTESKPLEYWVLAYRTITGACQYGTNNFLSNNKDKVKKQMTLQDVITATEGQYGSHTFKEFFENN